VEESENSQRIVLTQMLLLCVCFWRAAEIGMCVCHSFVCDECNPICFWKVSLEIVEKSVWRRL